VANGDHVATAGVCRKTRIFIDSEKFFIDLFVIPLDGYDMVLGVHWHRTLGPILWDFAHDHMSEGRARSGAPPRWPRMPWRLLT
jgi:hypothetical protein